jgi:TonB family protein
MLDSSKTRPNHYETLGLTPSATSDDIDKAFAARMKMRTTIPEEPDDYPLRLREAYKTLHDPFWRRIYDAELGLGSEPRSEPVLSHPPQAADEQRVAPFIAAALREPASRTESADSPNFILVPDPQDSEPAVEQSLEPHIAGYGSLDPIEGESTGPDARARPSEWNRMGVGTGVAVLSVGLLTLVIGLLSGNVERPPNAPGAPAVGAERFTAGSGKISQTAPQQAAPVDAGAPQLPAEAVTSAFSPVVFDDLGSIPTGAAQAPANNVAVEPQPAEQPESATTANPESAADPLAPLPSPIMASSAEPLAPTPAPAAATQSPPAAVAQVANTAPAARAAPAVNRAAPARWISGRLVKEDNPRGHFRGTVTVHFTVHPNGQVTGCRASASSGNPALDLRTCRLVEYRVRFSPALDPQGRPITSEAQATYTWGVKQRPLLDGLRKLFRR